MSKNLPGPCSVVISKWQPHLALAAVSCEWQPPSSAFSLSGSAKQHVQLCVLCLLLRSSASSLPRPITSSPDSKSRSSARFATSCLTVATWSLESKRNRSFSLAADACETSDSYLRVANSHRHSGTQSLSVLMLCKSTARATSTSPWPLQHCKSPLQTTVGTTECELGAILFATQWWDCRTQLRRHHTSYTCAHFPQKGCFSSTLRVTPKSTSSNLHDEVPRLTS